MKGNREPPDASRGAKSGRPRAFPPQFSAFSVCLGRARAVRALADFELSEQVKIPVLRTRVETLFCARIQVPSSAAEVGSAAALLLRGWRRAKVEVQAKWCRLLPFRGAECLRSRRRACQVAHAQTQPSPAFQSPGWVVSKRATHQLTTVRYVSTGPLDQAPPGAGITFHRT